MDNVLKFERAMFDQGITISERIIPDGELHRFHIEGDKSGSKNGWYILFIDPIACGIFGSWKLGSQHKWIDNNPIALQNPGLLSKKIEELKKKKKEELENIQRIAAEKSKTIWKGLKQASKNHPYLLKKKITNSDARILGSALVLPVIDFEDNIHCLQYIYPDGTKRFSAGGKKSGNFIRINYNDSKFLIIGEGFATCKTIQEFYPSYNIIAALDSGNLKPVAELCLKYYPHHQIIICGDDDKHLPNNPGKTKAHEAALICGAQVIFPIFPPNSPPGLSDFNDLHLFLNKDVL